MPGLVGIVDIGNRHSADNRFHLSMDAMIQPLLYHDWYKVDRLCLQGISVACVHTGILHETTLLSTDSGIHVLLHGEIYNDDLFGMSQLEYIANCYRENGKSFAKKLNGSFAILLVDEKKRLILLATDRIGSKPIVYFKQRNRIFFAPELKSILKVPRFNPRPSLEAVADIITNGYIIGRRTLVEEAYFLDYASVLEISAKNGFNVHRYWHFSIDEEAEDLGNKYYEKALADLLHQAVKRRMRSSHKFGILLSGGIDSRGILGFYLQEKKKPTTISYGISSYKYGDIEMSQRLADAVGAEHIQYNYGWQDLLPSFRRYTNILDGMGTAQMEWSIYKRIREDHGIEVVFAGDECFGWHDADLHNEEEMLAMVEIFSLDLYKPDALPLKEEAYNRLSQVSKDNIAQLSQSCELKDLHNRKDFFYFDQTVFSLTNPWRYAHSTEVEVRNPWFDNDILDFMTNVPVKYRRGKAVLYRSGKSLFRNTVRKMFPDLFKINEARTRSRPTSDEWAWWRSEFRQEIEGELLHNESAADCLFDQRKLLSLAYSDKHLPKVGQKGKGNILKRVLRNSPSVVYSTARRLQMSLEKQKLKKAGLPPLSPPDWRKVPQIGIPRIIRLRRILKNMSSVF